MVCGYLGVEERPSQVLQLSPKKAWGVQANSSALDPHAPCSQHLVMVVLMQVMSFASRDFILATFSTCFNMYICVIFFFSKKPPEGKGQLDIAGKAGLNSYGPGNKSMSYHF